MNFAVSSGPVTSKVYRPWLRVCLVLSNPIIRVVTGQTVRAEDGLALSSRNQYLTDDERTIAPGLFEVLQGIGDALRSGERNFEELQADGVTALEQLGFVPDYVVIRRAENLALPGRDFDELVIFAGATLGAARLIDNVIVSV